MLEMLESARLGSFTFPLPTTLGQVRIQEFCTPDVGNNSLGGVRGKDLSVKEVREECRRVPAQAYVLVRYGRTSYTEHYSGSILLTAPTWIDNMFDNMQLSDRSRKLSEVPLNTNVAAATKLHEAILKESSSSSAADPATQAEARSMMMSYCNGTTRALRTRSERYLGDV